MTKAFVVGWPIAHSRSPLIHGFWLKRHGIAGTYERIAVPPEEFARFIGDDIRKDPVLLSQDAQIQKLLEYYMGKNTPERKDYIMGNLVVTVGE